MCKSHRGMHIALNYKERVHKHSWKGVEKNMIKTSKRASLKAEG